MVRQMTILTEFGNLHISLKWKDILPGELSSGFSHGLAYLPWKCERDRIFDPCRVIFHIYGQGLLNCCQGFALFPIQELRLMFLVDQCLTAAP